MILGYIRVSSSDQAKDDRSSLQVQTDIIEGYARTRGADKYDVQIYSDAGVSGATRLAHRPAGEKLLADMRPGDTVIASKLDRMFRSAVDATRNFELFQEKGVDLILFDISHEPISKGVGKLIMTILAAVADMERVRIADRTAEGRKAKKARGGALGEAPLGYRKVGERHAAVLELEPREQEAMALMHDAYQSGVPIVRIPEALAQRGYLSRAGKPYTPVCVRRVILREETAQ